MTKTNRFFRTGFREKPYHRWEKETKKQYCLFLAYCSLKPEHRDLEKLAKAKKVNFDKLVTYVEIYEWIPRAQAWDEEEERQLRWKKLRKIEKMNETQADFGLMCQSFGLKQLRKMMAKADAFPDVYLSTSALIQMVRLGTDLERVARGEATEIVETKDNDLDMSKLTVEELLELQRMKEKSRKK